jgi:hypothetical protein
VTQMSRNMPYSLRLVKPHTDNHAAFMPLLQYVVETRFVGEVEHGVAGAEIVDVKDRVVDVAAPGPACPANAGMCCCHSLLCLVTSPYWCIAVSASGSRLSMHITN